MNSPPNQEKSSFDLHYKLNKSQNLTVKGEPLIRHDVIMNLLITVLHIKAAALQVKNLEHGKKFLILAFYLLIKPQKQKLSNS